MRWYVGVAALLRPNGCGRAWRTGRRAWSSLTTGALKTATGQRIVAIRNPRGLGTSASRCAPSSATWRTQSRRTDAFWLVVGMSLPHVDTENYTQNVRISLSVSDTAAVTDYSTGPCVHCMSLVPCSTFRTFHKDCTFDRLGGGGVSNTAHA